MTLLRIVIPPSPFCFFPKAGFHPRIKSEGRFFRDHAAVEYAMSDIADASAEPSTRRDEHTDRQAFAQVEKWMAMIREIDREQQTEHKRAD
jgi:hypothetical protein